MGGRKIAAHAHGTEGIKNAILAGIDSIEHASLIDDEGIRLAKEHGTYLVMDIYNDDYILNEAPKYGLPTENLDKERMVGRLQRENFRKAFQAGVKMAFGTDAGVYPHGDNAKQFFYMVKFGMTPAQAIRAATSSAADLIGRAKDVGTIEAGKVCRHHRGKRRSDLRCACAGARGVCDEGRRDLQRWTNSPATLRRELAVLSFSCHPERSSGFASRSHCEVEGPLVAHDTRRSVSVGT